MADQVQRTFTIERQHQSGTFSQSVYFTTFSNVFDIAQKVANGEKITTDFGKLAIYLASVFWSGAPDTQGKKSVSSCPLLQCASFPCQSDLPTFARDANYDDQGRFQHRIVQRHLMKEDSRSFASEVPVWDDELRGHIDLIRILGPDMIEVADFKPAAKNEKQAASQLYRYCHLLSQRTGIPLDHMQATYFDKDHAYSVIL